MAATDVFTGPRGLSHPEFSAATATIAVHGDLDASAIPGVAREMAHSIATGHVHVVLDIADVGFADAAGLAFVVRARRHMAGRGGDVNVTGASAEIRRLLAVCGLSHPEPGAPR